MATWNTDKPAVGNEISADIPDIEENFQELHDVITAITNGTLGTTTAANFAVDSLADGTTGFASTTCQPFYQNAAPTNWTRYADLTDASLFSYSKAGNMVTGGSASAIAGHTHEYTEVPNHVHPVPVNTVAGGSPTKIARTGPTTTAYIDTSNPTGGVASGTTVANTAPYYIEMMLVKVD